MLLDKVMRRANYLFGQQQMTGLPSSIFREIVKRLQAFGLIGLHIETNKIVDNVFLSLQVFDDELVTGFIDNEEAKLIAAKYEHLNEAFQN